ncbi:MAG: hypothetical protein BWY95_01513 [Bacteroidetes bacterium ADurb.BinA104]|nr:MAG: hypothetical protein BWY95_01513 [Bacteroidetes bacterium ADurb.BinA104]
MESRLSGLNLSFTAVGKQIEAVTPIVAESSSSQQIRSVGQAGDNLRHLAGKAGVSPVFPERPGKVSGLVGSNLVAAGSGGTGPTIDIGIKVRINNGSVGDIRLCIGFETFGIDKNIGNRGSVVGRGRTDYVRGVVGYPTDIHLRGIIGCLRQSNGLGIPHLVGRHDNGIEGGKIGTIQRIFYQLLLVSIVIIQHGSNHLDVVVHGGVDTSLVVVFVGQRFPVDGTIFAFVTGSQHFGLIQPTGARTIGIDKHKLSDHILCRCKIGETIFIAGHVEIPTGQISFYIVIGLKSYIGSHVHRSIGSGTSAFPACKVHYGVGAGADQDRGTCFVHLFTRNRKERRIQIKHVIFNTGRSIDCQLVRTDGRKMGSNRGIRHQYQFQHTGIRQ